ncbi:uncharacterized protein BDW43DRAFT_319124 [Aspergillus alliaceus]|uniref:uncharacterized protein n=1 Tax=Petromyces alliaceus TaxID=209559 RepID=UPI0012A57EFE|nr:uncharacterized protein BDW43DRAFT_319124 [Aspergillus alliaceus]KAB8238766.1 hypothetical protein BDW43DRAFT_319124 [Aspergillus alliaceus]
MGHKGRDEADMARHGKKQRLHRNFGFLSKLSFMTTMMRTWEAVLTSGIANPTAMFDGGPATLVYGYIFCWFGALVTAASLAEMASMEYHWVSMLAPKCYAVFLSWITGWVDMIRCVTVTQGLLVLNYPSYDHKQWHGALMFAASLVCVGMNSVGARVLPKVGGLILFYFVFETFINSSRWSSAGLTWLIGLMGTNLPFIAEEVVNASTIVPWTMICAVINRTLGFAIVLAFLFCLFMAAMPIALSICASFGFLASTSRLTWALARNRALPFSDFFSHVNPGSALPLRAICLLTKKIKGDPNPYGPWRRGRLGLLVNFSSMDFLLIAIFFSFFPNSLLVTAENMNWSIAMLGGELIIRLAWYTVHGRHVYSGPIIEIDVPGEDSVPAINVS